MAKASLPILPFPADADRDAFGHWLTGFADGEGCFLLSLIRQTQGRCRSTPGASFAFIQRGDDHAILEKIRSFWGCGGTELRPSYTTNPNPTYRYRANRIDDLVNVIVPHFERYPLESKKARDFVIWKEGVALMRQVIRRGRCKNQTWTDAEISQFVLLRDALRGRTQYNGPVVCPPPLPLSPDDDFPLFNSL